MAGDLLGPGRLCHRFRKSCSRQTANLFSSYDSRVPVTVLTGFLGSGKTTLLNHIRTAAHGKKLAVIETGLGEVSAEPLN